MGRRLFGPPPQFEGASLTVMQRVLLTTDGTVTNVVEAHAGEAVTVVKLVHEEHPHTGPEVGCEAALLLDEYEPVLHRHVLLRGVETSTDHLYAESLIASSRLAAGLLHDLFATETPLGRLFLSHQVEAIRYAMAAGVEPAGPCARHFKLEESAPVLFRTYLVVSGGRPLMVITEKFPVTSFS